MSSKGWCSPGFESVQQLFDKHLQTIEEHAQVCAFVNGEKVVDLFGSANNNAAIPGSYGTYSGTTVQNVYSSTKAITSLVVAILEDRGHLSYSQLVTDLWPEYGQNGKEGTTIAMVMRHEAGLPYLQLPVECLKTENIKKGEASNRIAKAKPKFPNGSTNVADRINDPDNDKRWRAYHATSRGYIVNEIVRRADPLGRTIGEFLREEIANPLQISDTELFIGLKNEKQKNNIADITSIFAYSWETWQSIVYPSIMGGQTVPLKSWWLKFWLALGIPLGHLIGAMGIGGGVIKQLSGVKGLSKESENLNNPYNSIEMRSIEIPSANGHANARSLAKIATVLVEGGAIGNARLLSKNGVDRAVGGGVKASMGAAGMLTNADFRSHNTFTNAGWNQFSELPKDTGRDGWIGWLGVGGSVLQWYHNDNYRIGFGFCGTLMHLIPTNERALALQNEIQKCCEIKFGKRGVSKL